VMRMRWYMLTHLLQMTVRFVFVQTRLPESLMLIQVRSLFRWAV